MYGTMEYIKDIGIFYAVLFMAFVGLCIACKIIDYMFNDDFTESK